MAQAAEAGFVPVVPPVLVRPEAMEGTGFLAQAAENVYHLPDEDLYLVGTSEVPLAAFHMDEVLAADRLPLRYAGWSTCFRKEAGSYGKDTRGILRVHQFDKVEMFSYVAPEDAAAEHQRLLDWEKEMLAKVELPYRVIDVAAGDLGSSAARKYDCEAWVPTQGRYRELTSTSNCTTFQARRLRIRVKDDQGVRPLATLNGTLATTRWIVAILENHQQADGSVRVPAALRPYLGGREVLEPVALRDRRAGRGPPLGGPSRRTAEPSVARELIGRRCTRFLGGHGPRSPAEVLAEGSADGSWVDDGGPAGTARGESSPSSRPRWRDLLGKPAAVFMPSGTMAQQIALRVTPSAPAGRSCSAHPNQPPRAGTDGPGGEDVQQARHGSHRDCCGRRQRERPAAADRPGGAARGAPRRCCCSSCRNGRSAGSSRWDELVAQTEAWPARTAPRCTWTAAGCWSACRTDGRTAAEVAGLFDSVYLSLYKDGSAAWPAACWPAGWAATTRAAPQRSDGGTRCRGAAPLTSPRPLDQGVRRAPGRDL